MRFDVTVIRLGLTYFNEYILLLRLLSLAHTDTRTVPKYQSSHQGKIANAGPFCEPRQHVRNEAGS